MLVPTHIALHAIVQQFTGKKWKKLWMRALKIKTQTLKKDTVLLYIPSADKGKMGLPCKILEN